MTKLKILRLPALERAVALAKEAVALSCIGALTGPPGTGKTTALQHIESAYASLGLPGTAFYYRCTQAGGGTQALKDMLESLGVRPSLLPRGTGLRLAVKVAKRELDARGVRLLLADGIDSYSAEGLAAVVALLDICRREKPALALVCASERDLSRWLTQNEAAVSRTLRRESFGYLSQEAALGVLREWLPDAFGDLAVRVEAGDKEAARVARLLHRRTGGSLRRLEYLTGLFGALGASARADLPTVTATLDKMTLEVG